MMGAFKVALVAMAFYSLAITIIVYTLPSSVLSYQDVIGRFGSSDDYSLGNIGSSVGDSLGDQTSLPSIDIGALVFYSGNLIVDLLVNFITAVPQMIALFINGLLSLVNVNSYFVDLIQIFFSVVFTAIYIIGLIQLLVGARTGRVIN